MSQAPIRSLIEACSPAGEKTSVYVCRVPQCCVGQAAGACCACCGCWPGQGAVACAGAGWADCCVGQAAVCACAAGWLACCAVSLGAGLGFGRVTTFFGLGFSAGSCAACCARPAAV